MPVYTVKMMENLAKICGVTITDAVRQGIGSLPPDDKQGVLAQQSSRQRKPSCFCRSRSPSA